MAATVLEPPRLTGDTQADFRVIKEYLHDFHALIIRGLQIPDNVERMQTVLEAIAALPPLADVTTATLPEVAQKVNDIIEAAALPALPTVGA